MEETKKAPGTISKRPVTQPREEVKKIQPKGGKAVDLDDDPIEKSLKERIQNGGQITSVVPSTDKKPAVSKKPVTRPDTSK